jgi:transposase-like protein
LRRKREGIPLSIRHCKVVSENQALKSPLQHLLATEKLDEIGVGVYCREQGIHSFQLKKWKDEFMNHHAVKKQPDKLSHELKTLRQENRRLKKDLKRKNKALAETSALLVLKKKANLIWGDPEED